MRIPLHHMLCFPAAQTLQFMRWRSCFPMPSGKGVTQVMPAKILNPGPLQRIAPSLGVDLDDWMAIIGKNVHRVIALTLHQHFHGGLIQWH